MSAKDLMSDGPVIRLFCETFIVVRALSINTASPVKLLNETQNVWALDLLDRKIYIKLE